MQKEKIAHEKHLLSQGVDFKYLPNIQYNELENVYELIEWDEEYSEALNEINSSWCTWQAAKAQAVQEKDQPSLGHKQSNMERHRISTEHCHAQVLKIHVRDWVHVEQDFLCYPGSTAASLICKKLGVTSQMALGFPLN